MTTGTPITGPVSYTHLDVYKRQVRGGNRHGLEFLEAVQAAGAIAVVWEPPYAGPLPAAGSGSPLLAMPDLRRNLGLIASRFYAEPSRHMAVVGITGTDGKTSCAHFIAQALSDTEAGPCGLLGTLGLGVYGAVEPTLHTTCLLYTSRCV